MRNVPVLLLKGVFVGLANIIPGVSGGTVALVLGIYDRLIRAIGNLGPKTLGRMVTAFKTRPRGRSLAAFARDHDLPFLGLLCVGALAAIVATSELMKYLLQEQHDPTYGFFFGLIAASIVVPLAMVGRRTWRELASGLLAVVLVVGLGEAKSPDERFEAAQTKETMRAASGEASAPGEAAPGAEADAKASAKAAHDPATLALFVVAGGFAISAMILPGVSGSFIMLLFGLYFDLLAAISDRDFVVLGVFAVGCLVGILLFSRLLAFLLERYRSLTMAFLVGLMVGSLWSIWPFKDHRHTTGGKRVDLANEIPGALDGNVITTVVAAAIGVAIVLGFLAWEKARERRGSPTTPA